MTRNIERTLSRAEQAAREARDRLLIVRTVGATKEDLKKEIKLVMVSSMRVGIEHMQLVHALSAESGIPTEELYKSVSRSMFPERDSDVEKK